MSHRIQIFGASGSGTTTLGRHLAKELGGIHLDADDYYWLRANPPFTDKHDSAERVALIEHDVRTEPSWILSGSICSWGDPLLDRFIKRARWQRLAGRALTRECLLSESHHSWNRSGRPLPTQNGIRSSDTSS
jgi:adenylate kinase family enzyme